MCARPCYVQIDEIRGKKLCQSDNVRHSDALRVAVTACVSRDCVEGRPRLVRRSRARRRWSFRCSKVSSLEEMPTDPPPPGRVRSREEWEGHVTDSIEGNKLQRTEGGLNDALLDHERAHSGSEGSQPGPSPGKLEDVLGENSLGEFNRRLWRNFEKSRSESKWHESAGCFARLKYEIGREWNDFEKTLDVSDAEERFCRLSHDAYEECDALRATIIDGGLLAKLDDESVSEMAKAFAEWNLGLMAMQQERAQGVVKKRFGKVTKLVCNMRKQLGSTKNVRGLPMDQPTTSEEKIANHTKFLGENLPEVLATVMAHMHEDSLPSLGDESVFIAKWMESLGYKGDVGQLVKTISSQREDPMGWIKSVLLEDIGMCNNDEQNTTTSNRTRSPDPA